MMKQIADSRWWVGRRFYLILFILLTLTACGGNSTDQAWEQVSASGVLRVGMDASYPPFENDDNGTFSGFDVDFANELGQRLGLEVTFTNIAYDGLYDALLVGRVDLLISALVAAPQFEGKANFTTPYFNAGEFLIVPEGSAIREMGDLAGMTLAVEYGSGGDVEARQWERRLENLTIQRHPDPAAAIQAVANGEADAVLIDGISARQGIGQHDNLYLAENVVDTLYAVAVHPDSTVLLEEVDKVVVEMIYDGTVAALIEKWFGPQRGY